MIFFHIRALNSNTQNMFLYFIFIILSLTCGCSAKLKSVKRDFACEDLIKNSNKISRDKYIRDHKYYKIHKGFVCKFCHVKNLFLRSCHVLHVQNSRSNQNPLMRYIIY